MTMFDTGITGAKRVSWAHDNPRDLLLQLRKQYPDAICVRDGESLLSESSLRNDTEARAEYKWWMEYARKAYCDAAPFWSPKLAAMAMRAELSVEDKRKEHADPRANGCGTRICRCGNAIYRSRNARRRPRT
jgi:hypothetical protein